VENREVFNTVMKKIRIISILIFGLILSSCSLNPYRIRDKREFYILEWLPELGSGYQIPNFKIFINSPEDLEEWKEIIKNGGAGPISGPYKQISKFEIQLVKP
jgi:hypothetical protein